MHAKIFLVVMAIFSAPMVAAECTSQQIEDALKELGLFHRQYDASSWHIGNSSELLFMRVDMDDGDVVWQGIVETDSRVSVAWINQIHLEWRYVQLAVDPDLDLVASFSVPSWRDGCPPDIPYNANYFLEMMSDLKEDLASFRQEHQTQLRLPEQNDLNLPRVAEIRL